MTGPNISDLMRLLIIQVLVNQLVRQAELIVHLTSLFTPFKKLPEAINNVRNGKAITFGND